MAFNRNDQTDNDATLCIDDSDTISNQSTENVEREQQDFDQRWAMSLRMDNGEMINNCEAFNSLDEVELFIQTWPIYLYNY